MNIELSLSTKNAIIITNNYSLIRLLKHTLFEEMCGSIQRNLDTEHYTNILNYQKNYYEKYKEFNFINPIIIVELNNKYAVVDGQHRIMVIKALTDMYKIQFNFYLQILNIKTQDEYDDLFLIINKNKPVAIHNNIVDWKTYYKQIERFFINEYGEYCKTSSKPQMPNINVEAVTSYMESKDFVKLLNIPVTEIIDEIKEINNFIGLNWISYIKDLKYIKDIDNLIIKCKSKPIINYLYLGIYRNFEWIDNIIIKVTQKKTYHDLNYMRSNYRPRITKHLRNNVWKKRNITLEGTCFVCNHELLLENMECGHIIPLIYGGETNIDNLEPICSSCNNDIKTDNLLTYKDFHNTQVM